MHAAFRSPRSAAGFTLVEITITLAVALILASAAWPSQEKSLQRARRADAIAALTRVQFAQEQYRAHHGIYAATLAALQGAASPRSPEGLYDVALTDASGGRVVLAAAARPDGLQARDADCARLTIRLDQGLADFGPSARCWNR
jgi:type IV pilus assembly protein PilE